MLSTEVVMTMQTFGRITLDPAVMGGNARPAWLANLHAALNANGWPSDLSDDELLERSAG